MGSNKTYTYIGNYCKDEPFWNNDISWNTDNPDFTLCFIDTVPVWIPFIYILCSLILRPEHLTCKWKRLESDDGVKLTAPKIINNGRLGLCLLFLSNAILKMSLMFSLALSSHHHFLPLFFSSPAIYVNQIVSVISASMAVLIAKSQIYDAGYDVSCVSFIFWSLTFCLQLFPFQHYVRQSDKSHGAQLEGLAIGNYVATSTSFLIMLLGCLRCWGLEGSHYDRACPLSRWSFFWITPTLRSGVKKLLSYSNLDPLPYEFKLETILKIYDNKYSSIKLNDLSQSKKSFSFISKLMGCYKKEFLFLFILRVFYAMSLLVKPICLGWLINHVLSRDMASEPDGSITLIEFKWKGIFYTLLLFSVSILGAFLHWIFWWHMNFIALKIQNTAMFLVFKKSLLITSSFCMTATIGEIINIMSVDTQRFFRGLEQLVAGLIAPIELLAVIWLLYNQIGLATFAGLAFFALSIPISVLAGQHIAILQEKNMTFKDSRVKLMNEILNGIKVVKLYSWEAPFMKEVAKIREQETDVLKRQLYWLALLKFNYNSVPIIVSVIAFTTFILSSAEHTLTPEKAFVSMALFKHLRILLWAIPDAIYQNVQMFISSRRIEKFLNSSEIDRKYSDPNIETKKAVYVKNASFSWEKGGPVTLKNITFSLNKGQILAVVGSVGSGKSTLLSALLGEMNKVQGEVHVMENFGYVAQNPWIQNGSIKENILFGKPMNENKYKNILKACALMTDLQALVNGDETKIGDRGINLSGGQKVRISLARAIYADADLYLLDDPLSAVDANVRKLIFDEVLSKNGLLKEKSIIMVTNDTSYLSAMDSVIYLHLGEVIQKSNLEDMIQANINSKAKQEKPRQDSDFVTIKKGTNLLSSDVALSEETIRGKISGEVYVTYFKCFGWFLFMIFMFAFMAMQSFELSSSIQLSDWVDNISIKKKMTKPIYNQTRFEKDTNQLIIYNCLRLASSIFLGLATTIHVLGTIKAACRLHHNLTKRVLALPMCFLDTVPLGRIMNRFSSDIETVDSKLPEKLFIVFQTLMVTIFSFLLIAWMNPWFVTIIPFILVFCYAIKYVFVEGTRQLQRFESMSRSPIFSLFQETLQGVTVIRAFKRLHQFKQECMLRINKNFQTSFLLWGANRWISFNLEILGCFVVLFCSIYSVLDETTSAGKAGLVISYAIEISNMFGESFREVSYLENLFVSVERIQEYSTLPIEALRLEETSPSIHLGDKGEIVFKNYSARYREDLDYVLKKLNFQIEGGLKVGVVGRTGAGKSSLTLALFRILEAAEGHIEVDKQKINELDLHELRNKFSIIPQDPVIFAGTLRSNLDPFNHHTDNELWKALEQAHLQSFVSNVPGGLDMQCAEAGNNLSAGQRQLICLARTLLRSSKILILDEATAAVDAETDALIQKTIREEFKSCTVLTIAHRIHTIMDYDIVIVVDDGKILEFNKPNILAKDPSSAFYRLAKDAGIL